MERSTKPASPEGSGLADHAAVRHSATRPRRRRKLLALAIGLFLVGVIAFAALAHPFLAITKRVEADVLVVEGWIPHSMMTPAAAEFRQQPYAWLLTSGLENDPNEKLSDTPSYAHRAAERLEHAGVERRVLVPCPAPFARWNRTAKTARAVREKLAELGFQPKGINVLTAGPHARETWVAYQHAFGPTPVGIISVPKQDYPADRWWMTRRGLIWVPKDFAGWLKEVLFGARG